MIFFFKMWATMVDWTWHCVQVYDQWKVVKKVFTGSVKWWEYVTYGCNILNINLKADNAGSIRTIYANDE